MAEITVYYSTLLFIKSLPTHLALVVVVVFRSQAALQPPALHLLQKLSGGL